VKAEAYSHAVCGHIVRAGYPRKRRESKAGEWEGRRGNADRGRDGSRRFRELSAEESMRGRRKKR